MRKRFRFSDWYGNLFVLPVYFGMTGVWLAAPVTEAVTLVLSGVLVWRENEKTGD